MKLIPPVQNILVIASSSVTCVPPAAPYVTRSNIIGHVVLFLPSNHCTTILLCLTHVAYSNTFPTITSQLLTLTPAFPAPCPLPLVPLLPPHTVLLLGAVHDVLFVLHLEDYQVQALPCRRLVGSGRQTVPNTPSLRPWRQSRPPPPPPPRQPWRPSLYGKRP